MPSTIITKSTNSTSQHEHRELLRGTTERGRGGSIRLPWRWWRAPLAWHPASQTPGQHTPAKFTHKLSEKNRQIIRGCQISYRSQHYVPQRPRHPQQYTCICYHTPSSFQHHSELLQMHRKIRRFHRSGSIFCLQFILHTRKKVGRIWDECDSIIRWVNNLCPLLSF